MKSPYLFAVLNVIFGFARNQIFGKWPEMHRQYLCYFQHFSTLIFLTFPYPEFSEVTWGWATGGGLYLSFLHVEAVLDILRDVSPYAGHVPTLSQPG